MFETLTSRKGLSLDRLRVLVEVADSGGISRAVGDDPTRQSQYSRQLKELGQAFGVELTCRKGRSLKLTPAGERLAALTRQTFVGLADFAASVEQRQSLYRIGAGDFLLQWSIIPILTSFRNAFPQAQFACTNRRTNDIVAALHDFSIDLGLIRSNAAPASLNAIPAGSLEYRLFVPRNMVPNKMPKRTARLLTELPLATLDEAGDYTVGLETIAQDIGNPLMTALTCSTLLQVCQAIRCGGYVGVLPTQARQVLVPKEFLELDIPELHTLRRPLAMCWDKRMGGIREGLERMAKSIAQQMRDSVATMQMG